MSRETALTDLIWLTLNSTSDNPMSDPRETPRRHAMSETTTDPLTDDWRDLDRQVARRVLGWGIVPATGEYADGRGRGTDQFHPSTDIADAFEIVDHLRAAGWHFDLSVSRDYATGANAEFLRAGCQGHAHAGTVQLAICRAAIAARDT